MAFWSAFNVSSRRYKTWLKEHHRDETSVYIGGCNDWNIPGWRESEEHRYSYYFTDPATRVLVLEEWFSECSRIGLPYLERLSSWDGAAADLLRQNWHWEMAADFYEIGGNPGMAIKALERGISALRTQNFSYSEKSHSILVRKKQRQAAERDATIDRFEARIKVLQNVNHALHSDRDSATYHPRR
jgi:hypothetical protein